jgi:hypothetical protein
MNLHPAEKRFQGAEAPGMIVIAGNERRWYALGRKFR